MPRRSTPFTPGAYYHVYNHSVEGRNLVEDVYDAGRLVQALSLFNTVDPIGSIYAQQFAKQALLRDPEAKPQKPLVDVICYCFNPNHYHILLREVEGGGVTEFMKRLGGGYASYYNCKYERHGPLYQNRFQARPVATNEYLLWVSAYINLNDRVHQLRDPEAKLVRSSWQEYVQGTADILCRRDVVLAQFTTSDQYKTFAESAVELIQERRDGVQLIEQLGVV